MTHSQQSAIHVVFLPKYFPMISRMLITILRFTGKETFLPGKEISVTALSSLLKEVYAEK